MSLQKRVSGDSLAPHLAWRLKALTDCWKSIVNISKQLPNRNEKVEV